MEINQIRNYYRTQSKITTGRPNRISTENTAKEGNAVDVRATAGDSIDISSEASFKAQLGKYSKMYASQSANGVSKQRIADLKEQYSGDNCPVSSRNIAMAVMQYTLSEGE